MHPGARAVRGRPLTESALPHGPRLSRKRVAVQRTGAYRTMIGLDLLAVMAAVVDWSVFRWA